MAVSQAGGTVSCSECGASLPVPRLRDLRDLPVEACSQSTGGGWGFRQGVLTAGLLLAAALAAGAGWFTATEPEAPPEFDAASRDAVVEADLEKMAPVDLWSLYLYRYAPMMTNGMQVAPNPGQEYAQRLVDRNRMNRDLCLYGAGGVLALSLGAFALLPR